jgi:2-polyprenyl-3-methyl-5-hydroxy-6-metoxy-1,4-benzoquinol methylase
MPHCRLCQSENVEYLFDVRDTPEYRVYLCKECAAEYLSPQPTEAVLRDLYSKSYYDAWGIEEDSGSVRDMKLSTFELRLDLIKRYKNKGKILDVGCATGFFLEGARDAGFMPFGVEFSDYSSKIAKEKFGEDAIFHGIVEESPFAERSFDVIAMSDLLEHVRNPHAVLEKIQALLKDDGIVMIMTPDTDSLTRWLMRGRWVHYKLEHLFYFNGKSMRRLADRHGLQVLRQESARKALNITYFHRQFEVYRHWLLTPFIRQMHILLPPKLQRLNFRVTIGEMVLVLHKTAASRGKNNDA